MRGKAYREFLYLESEDYDKEQKINGDRVKVYSEKKLNDLYPEKDYTILGETFEKKKRDKDSDIGKIELNDKWLYVSEHGKHNKLLKKQGGFVAVQGGGFIALLKLRLLPILLAVCVLLGAVGGILASRNHGGIQPIDAVVLTISGTVTKDGQPVENASLSLQSGNQEVATATTDADGKYLINDVKNGNYNLVCTNGDSVLTKIASVWGESIVVDFRFPADDLHDVEEITDCHEKENLPESHHTGEISDVKALVKIAGENTPAIAVGGLAEEAMLHMIEGKEVDLTFTAQLLDVGSVPAADKSAIQAICGELEMTYYDFSVLKEIFQNQQLESSEYLKNTKTVLEVAVPFDSSHSVATYAFRYHDGKALKLEELSEQPTGNYKDGTCYITGDTVYIYTNCFSTYAIGAANCDQVVRGSDTITYSAQATVNLSTKTISLLYKHDKDSSNDARVEVYLVGSDSSTLIAVSDTIPIGYQLESLKLKSGIKNMPSVGTYEGLMKISYLDSNGNTSTEVEIPLTVAVTK